MKFTNGKLEKLDSEYYNLTLFNNGKIVYVATISSLKVCEIIMKHKNIEISK